MNISDTMTKEQQKIIQSYIDKKTENYLNKLQQKKEIWKYEAEKIIHQKIHKERKMVKKLIFFNFLVQLEISN